ncbi:MAG TPA: MarR family winged helix-turn-helix transcriptional regulator [Mycobacteriales bacterium]|jgi:DNA-binding MarR family transcriptional regulator
MPTAPDQVPPDLGERLRDLLRAVRVAKARWLHQRSVIPSGMLGVLAAVDTLSAGRSPAGCHLKDLAARCALDSSTVSRAVTSLVGLGLVERSADPTDGRASLLLTTDGGRRALDHAHEWHREVLAGALHAWSPDDLEALDAMLRRFADDVMTHLNTQPAHTADHTTPEAAR